jgi:hypothetical protein
MNRDMGPVQSTDAPIEVRNILLFVVLVPASIKEGVVIWRELHKHAIDLL